MNVFALLLKNAFIYPHNDYVVKWQFDNIYLSLSLCEWALIKFIVFIEKENNGPLLI